MTANDSTIKELRVVGRKVIMLATSVLLYVLTAMI
jgi:hypothetical protein